MNGVFFLQRLIFLIVIPAQAGIQGWSALLPWVPAFAGTTSRECCE